MIIGMWKCEFIKAWTKKKFIFVLLFIILANLLVITTTDKVEYSYWHDNAETKYTEYSEALEECKEQDVPQSYYSVFEEKITLIEYALKNNVPIYVTTVLSHAQRMTNLLSIYMIIILLFGCVAFFNEYDSHTWKNLFATSINRNQIFISKFLFEVCNILIYLALFLIVSLLVGMISYGTLILRTSLTITSGNVIETDIATLIFIDYTMCFIKLLFFSSMIDFVLIITNNKMVSLVCGFALMFSQSWLNLLVGKYSFSKFLPFQYLNMDNILSISNLHWFFAVLTGYIAMIVLLSIFYFTKKSWDNVL